jgi:eukaryotic-like serine/threonine-protein kinase
VSRDLLVGKGSVLGERYHIVDVLGVGGSATVYRAEDEERDGALVVLKLMHASHPESETERRRFNREAAMVRGLRHPNVVELLDFGFTREAIPYLVFPLLEGRTLAARAEDDRFDWIEAGEITEQLLEALEAAHQRGIAHRDVKPANVFLCPTPQGERVLLLDFGLAKLTEGKRRMDLTQAGVLVGTPRYMAPEQARGEDVGSAADIYAAGLLLGEMVAGEALVRAKGEIDILATHGSDKPLALPDQLLRSPYAGIVQRAVAKMPERRYRVATQMLADVRAVLDAIGQGAPTDSDPELEVTSRHPRAPRRPLSVPNESSEKLRKVFNDLAQVSDDDALAARPTELRAVPEPRASEPIALTRRKRDD